MQPFVLCCQTHKQTPHTDRPNVLCKVVRVAYTSPQVALLPTALQCLVAVMMTHYKGKKNTSTSCFHTADQWGGGGLLCWYCVDTVNTFSHITQTPVPTLLPTTISFPYVQCIVSLKEQFGFCFQIRWSKCYWGKDID